MTKLRILDVGAWYGYDTAGLFMWERAPALLGVDEIEIYSGSDEHILDRIDMVAFGGGADVSPEIYGHSNLASCTQIGRDLHESELFETLRCRRIPMFGICRGAQFLNVMNNGTMIQDVGGHTVDHFVVSPKTGKKFRVTSTHHQMIVPAQDAPWSVLLVGTSMEHKRDIVYDGDLPTMPGDVEAIFYPETRCLGVQGHPEYSTASREFVDWTLNTIKEYLL